MMVMSDRWEIVGEQPEMAAPLFWCGVPTPLFWGKRLQAIENKRQEYGKESKERTRGGKLL
jgi:hypothetical protein